MDLAQQLFNQVEDLEDEILFSLLHQFEHSSPTQQASFIRTMVTFLQSVGNREYPFNVQSQDAINWTKSLVRTEDRALQAAIVLIKL